MMTELDPFELNFHRENRRQVIRLATWLLQQVYDAEQEYYDLISQKLMDLDNSDQAPNDTVYRCVEDEVLVCEHALGGLLSAIEDLELVYY